MTTKQHFLVTLIRMLYSCCCYLLYPFIIIYLLKRSKNNYNYRLFWNERFAINLQNPTNKPIIWIHSVSVGEVKASKALINILKQQYPKYQILLTIMTPTGRDIANNLFDDIIIHYLPYDIPHNVKNFYQIFNPVICLIMETEIWPNFIFYAHKYNIPIYLINARLSMKSYLLYNKIFIFIKYILNYLTGILCQDQFAVDHFKKLGYKNFIHVTGNTKFDVLENDTFTDKANKHLISLAQFFIQKIKNNKKIIIFASTKNTEEELIIKNIPFDFQDLMIIVPRHPERFKIVENILIKYNINYIKRSDNIPIDDNTQIFLGDSMYEMLMYYSMSDIAVMGGSFNHSGGQNLIEPIFLQQPVILGPSMFNFTDVANNAVNSNCAITVHNIVECFAMITKIINNQNIYNDMRSACDNFVKMNSGASERIINTVAHYLQ